MTKFYSAKDSKVSSIGGDESLKDIPYGNAGWSLWSVGGGGLNGAWSKHIVEIAGNSESLLTRVNTYLRTKPNKGVGDTVLVDIGKLAKEKPEIKVLEQDSQRRAFQSKMIYAHSPDFTDLLKSHHFSNYTSDATILEKVEKDMMAFGKKFREGLNSEKVDQVIIPGYSTAIFAGNVGFKKGIDPDFIGYCMMKGFMEAEADLKANLTSYIELKDVYFASPYIEQGYNFVKDKKTTEQVKKELGISGVAAPAADKAKPAASSSKTTTPPKKPEAPKSPAHKLNLEPASNPRPPLSEDQFFLAFQNNALGEKEINGSFWYGSSSVEKVMSAYALENGFKKEAGKGFYQKNGTNKVLGILPVKDNPSTLDEKGLRQLFVEMLKTNKTPLQVLIPINTVGHWTMIEVEARKQINGKWNFDRKFYNPSGQGRVNDQLDKSIVRAFNEVGGQISSGVAKGEKSDPQTDGSSCGPISCFYAGQRIRDEGVSGILNFEAGAKALRLNQLKMLAKFYEQDRSLAPYSLYRSQAIRPPLKPPVPVSAGIEKPKDLAEAITDWLIQSDKKTQYHSVLIDAVLNSDPRNAKSVREYIEKNYGKPDSILLSGSVDELFKASESVNKRLDAVHKNISTISKAADLKEAILLTLDALEEDYGDGDDEKEIAKIRREIVRAESYEQITDLLKASEEEKLTKAGKLKQIFAENQESLIKFIQNGQELPKGIFDKGALEKIGFKKKDWKTLFEEISKEFAEDPLLQDIKSNLSISGEDENYYRSAYKLLKDFQKEQALSGLRSYTFKKDEKLTIDGKEIDVSGIKVFIKNDKNKKVEEEEYDDEIVKFLRQSASQKAKDTTGVIILPEMRAIVDDAKPLQIEERDRMNNILKESLASHLSVTEGNSRGYQIHIAFPVHTSRHWTVVGLEITGFQDGAYNYVPHFFDSSTQAYQGSGDSFDKESFLKFFNKSILPVLNDKGILKNTKEAQYHKPYRQSGVKSEETPTAFDADNLPTSFKTETVVDTRFNTSDCGVYAMQTLENIALLGFKEARKNKSPDPLKGEEIINLGAELRARQAVEIILSAEEDNLAIKYLEESIANLDDLKDDLAKRKLNANSRVDDETLSNISDDNDRDHDFDDDDSEHSADGDDGPSASDFYDDAEKKFGKGDWIEAPIDTIKHPEVMETDAAGNVVLKMYDVKKDPKFDKRNSKSPEFKREEWGHWERMKPDKEVSISLATENDFIDLSDAASGNLKVNDGKDFKTAVMEYYFKGNKAAGDNERKEFGVKDENLKDRIPGTVIKALNVIRVSEYTKPKTR